MTSFDWMAVPVKDLEPLPEELQHFGVKGMRWGQTKDTKVTLIDGSSKMVTAKKAGKMDEKYDKQATDATTFIAVHNAAADHFNRGIDAVNAKHPGPFTDADFDSYNRPLTPQYKSYMKDVNELSRVGLEATVNRLNPSPTGKKKVKLNLDPESGGWHLTTEEVKHAAGDRVLVTPVFDANHRVVKLKFKEDTLTQAEDFVNALVHYGTKGMKWGKRMSDANGRRKSAMAKAEADRIAPRTVVTKAVPNSKGKTVVKAKGGEFQPAHVDAIAAKTSKQKLKKSGSDSLSDAQLKALANRMNLEQQVDRLSKTDTQRSAGEKFMAKFKKDNETQVQDAASKAGSAAVAKLMAKKLAGG